MNQINLEHSLLYALLNYGEGAYWELSEHVGDSAESLFTGPRRTVFRAIGQCITREQTPDIFVVTSLLDTRDEEAAETMQAVNLSFCGRKSITTYADAILENHLEAEAKNIGIGLMRGTLSASEGHEALQALVVSGHESDAATFDTMAAEFAAHVEASREGKIDRVLTGWKDLDEVLGWLEPGNVTVVAGRPGSGKTAFAVNLMMQARVTAMMFSLEMSRAEVYNRALMHFGVPGDELRNPNALSGESWKRVSEAMQKLSSLPLTVVDKGGISMTEIEAKVRRAARSTDLKLVIVDYLQLITCRAESRLQEVSAVSRRLKALAKNAGVCIVALAQLNRMVETRSNPVPMLADLRESGQIEQDADHVLFVHRPCMFEPDAPQELAEVHVKKNRHGRQGVVHLAWDGATTTFSNWSKDQWVKVAEKRASVESGSSVPF